MATRFLSTSFFKSIGFNQRRNFAVRANVGSDFDFASWTFEKDVLYQQGAANLVNQRRDQYEAQPDSFLLSFLTSLSKNKDQLQEELILSISDSKRTNLGKTYQRLDKNSPAFQLRSFISEYLTQVSQGVQQLEGLPNIKSLPLLTDKDFSKALSKDLQQRFAESGLDRAESEIAKRLANYREGPAPKAPLASPEVQKLTAALLSDDKLSSAFLQRLQQYLETGYYQAPVTWAQLHDLLLKAQTVLRGLIQERNVVPPQHLTVDELVEKVFPVGEHEFNYLKNWEEQRQQLLDDTFDYTFLEELDRRVAKALYPLLQPVLSVLEGNVAKRHQGKHQNSSLQQTDLERYQSVSRHLVAHEFQTLLSILDLPTIRQNVPQWQKLSNTQIVEKLKSWRRWLDLTAALNKDFFQGTFSKEQQKQLVQRVSSAAPAKRQTVFEQFCEENQVPASATKELYQYFVHQQNSEILDALSEHNVNLPVSGAATHHVRRVLNLALADLNNAQVTNNLLQNLVNIVGADSHKELQEFVEGRNANLAHETIPSIQEFVSLEGTEELEELEREADSPFVQLAFEGERLSGVKFSFEKKPGFVRLSQALEDWKESEEDEAYPPVPSKEDLWDNARRNDSFLFSQKSITEEVVKAWKQGNRTE
eukprot:TRINITY_DN1252_c0_g1_i1.p1 TRINITY_DN1252_c0_g1~~TRINITY_DN1252_c0_g1_i1.p1  ORF type:complete len:659 (-),score=228.31 TRINITY_DN1252_c0_g1_i1:177-2120(-)